MTVVGFNFTKILVEKKAPAAGKINIDNNVAIKDVSEIDLSLGKSKQKGLRFVFEFTSTYEPKIGNMLFAGEVLFLVEEGNREEIIKDWKKNKKLPKDIMTSIVNTALMRCNVEALILSREVALPPPIPMPKVGEKA